MGIRRGELPIQSFYERGSHSFQYHGGMSQHARDVAVHEFQEIAARKIFIMSLKTGGVGLNLVMACRVINVEIWWNIAVENQAYSRVWRIGQEHKCFVTRLVMKDTIEERIVNLQEEKSRRIDQAMGDEVVAHSFTKRDLLQLLGSGVKKRRRGGAPQSGREGVRTLSAAPRWSTTDQASDTRMADSE